MGTLKSFFLSVAKIASVIVIVTLILALLGWGIYEFKRARQEASEGLLAKPKQWGVVKLKALDDLELRLSTKWSEGSLYYRLSVEDYPDYLAEARDKAATAGSLAEPAWTLVFLDEHGFKVFEQEVPLSKMSKLVGDSTGKGSGLEINDRTYVDAETYRSASSWNVGWNFGLPKPAASSTRAKAANGGGEQGLTPSWRDKSRWRRLRLGMSKQDVRALLGEPESITEFGSIKVWYYGYARSGQVEFDENDNLSSWSEP